MELLSGKSSVRPVVSLLLACLLGLATTLNVVRADDQTPESLNTARQQLYQSYAAQLQTLAEKCAAHELPKQAEFTRHWLPERDSLMIYIFTLPASSAAPADLVKTPLAQKWWNRFMELRRAEAEELFSLAHAAVQAKQYALAFELARETVRENPEHEAARHVLGDQKNKDQWVSPEAARRLDAGQVWSDEFGWLPADRLARYQNGERYDRGNWISAAEDARLHSNINNGW
ncbi:MAG TPA: hypothetical protein VGJ04_02960, partial [Pirellulales bacterium]